MIKAPELLKSILNAAEKNHRKSNYTKVKSSEMINLKCMILLRRSVGCIDIQKLGYYLKFQCDN